MGDEKKRFLDGPLLVWHGQEHMATIIDEMGGAERHAANKHNPMSYCFDDRLEPWFQSGDSFLDKPKSLRIEFKVSPILAKMHMIIYDSYIFSNRLIL